MNWIKKITPRVALLLALPLVVIACTVSYKFNGSSINYDKVKTISIADFPIKSEYVYAPLATKFNEDLKDIFIRQTRLQLLKPNQNADLQIDGEITGYNQYMYELGIRSLADLRLSVASTNKKNSSKASLCLAST